MLQDAYLEVMIKKKTGIPVGPVRIVCVTLAVLFALAGVMGIWPGLIGALIFGVGAVLIGQLGEVEYEYIYVDRELQIDKIMGKSRRKRLETLDLNGMEILAPVKSHFLDSYRNGNYRKSDYSSGVEEQPDVRYALYMNGGRMILFEPGDKMVKLIQSFAPRKVFTY